MAIKLCTLSPTICFSSPTSINTKTSPCLTNTITITKTTIKNYKYQIRPPLLPAVRASSGPNSSEPTSPSNSVPPPNLQDDFTYLLKLAAGSIFGAALIKYGSAIIPDITKPNITQALLMISSPVVISILLLSNGSRKE
ncbi:uncharacterized protein LOC110698642 [Chenopodium quinoa]|uniref:uncharacterized protein LOC110698642 n=1 Tax=Chenopodium quinoa TaxID=63459 RepID=UPI000B774899|nr:uncharacterized protein LOC110698642 [Chenopodium quinoa]